MKIRIVAVAKTKEKYIEEGEYEYVKRLSPNADVELVRVADDEKLLKQIKSEYLTVALDVTGKEYTSEAFAKFIEEVRDFKGGKIAFLIGGPTGLPAQALQKASIQLSLSKMTLTHQMVRLVLLEQIYRAFQIVKGSGYHK